MDASPRGAAGAGPRRRRRGPHALSGAPPPDAPSKLSASQAFKAALLVGVVVQNAALNIAARWSRVEAAFAETGCGAATTVVLTVEVVKIAMALLLFALESGGVAPACAELARVTRGAAECGKIAVPALALIYVVQNNLLLVAAANLEGPVLALFGQLKILTTAVFSVALLGRTLGPRRWAALVALTAAIATVQVSQLRPAPESGDAGTKNVPLGLALTLVVATLSGFAGVYFEKVLKGSRISVWVRNVHLAAISSVVAGAAVASRDRGALSACGFFGGYGPVAWGYVLVQAVGGLLIAAVVKYADNILKAFATSVAIVVVALVSHAFFAFELSGLFFLGAAGVVYAIFLYGDLLRDVPGCRDCPPALGGAEVREPADLETN
ncbi:pyrimidine nucleotide-sugar transmembrane transporter [Aureococcus anophagefferens]|nr:pyrimidine nucleotide-sugar transmembrane transporter [Aureococcus anophagefferens]